MRQNRLNAIPIAKKKDVEKKFERGEMEATYNEDKTVCVWKDNKPVYVASNKYQVQPYKKAKRWSRVEKKYVEMQMPDLIHQYNQGMGGVDLLDASTAQYRSRIRFLLIMSASANEKT